MADRLVVEAVKNPERTCTAATPGGKPASRRVSYCAVDQKAGSVTAPARRTASAEWRNFVQLIQLTAGTNAGSAGDQQNNLALAHDAAYVGTKGINLLEITDRNQPLPGPGAIPPRRPLFLLSPDLTTNVGESVGNSNYPFASTQSA
jgi:hypothetical protein